MATRVGYTGGVKASPTYHNLGDHTETVEVDFDPGVVSYADLLSVFWRSHNPRSRSWSRQYRSAIFYHGEEQKRLAMEARDREAARTGGKIFTEIVPAQTFYRAEGYHQKYYLRQRPDLIRALTSYFGTEEKLMDSKLAARLNGRLAGYGATDEIEEELKDLSLSEEVERKIAASLPGSSHRSGAGSCPID